MQHDENSEFRQPGDLVEQLRRYAFAGVPLAGQHTAFYERHLKFDNVMVPTAAGARESPDNWLRRHDPSEVARPNEAASVALPRRIACKWHV
jgi:hypothetical protein